jgi:hypothetical protein
VSNSVTLHPTDSMKAATFVEKHVGTLASPPHTIERLKALGEPTEHIYRVGIFYFSAKLMIDFY